MYKRFFLPVILVLLAYVFWISPDFEEIAAGVAILLFGMMALENGFKTLTEGPLERLLAKATDKFYKSFTLGMVSTGILQSSSLISVITISFISAGLLTLTQGVGIIFGSNIGTTATAWLVAVLGLKIKISALAMPMLVFGMILIFRKSKTLKGLGNVLTGLGFLFLGIHFMKVGFDSYKEVINLSDYAMEGIPGLLVFTGIGIMATVILQSSSATMAVIITALAAGQITYFNSLALAIGANVGTTITAIIGALASNAAGKRLAGAHLIFNSVTALIALIFLNQIAWIVDYTAEALNIKQDDYTLKLAIFHTVFNVIGVVAMVPFVNRMVKFLEKHIKEQKLDVKRPKYLSKSALKYQQTALSALILETNHLFDHVFKIIAHGLGLHRTEVMKIEYGDSLKPITTVDIEAAYYRKVKYLYGEIIEFATRAQELHPDIGYIQTIYNIKEANRFFVDVVKDIKELQPNMLKYTRSDNRAMRKEYNKLRSKISKIIRLVFKAQKIDFPPDKSEKDITELINEHIDKRHQKFTKHLDRRKKFDVLFNGTIDKLIRDKEITQEMVSSLINDNALTSAITKHLILAGELLYLNTDVLMVEAEEQFVDQVK